MTANMLTLEALLGPLEEQTAGVLSHMSEEDAERAIDQLAKSLRIDSAAMREAGHRLPVPFRLVAIDGGASNPSGVI